LITFYTWLKKFHSQENSLGDLSRDAVRDPNFPRTRNYDVLLEHLKFSNASDNALDAFQKAFSFYQKDILNNQTNEDDSS